MLKYRVLLARKYAALFEASDGAKSAGSKGRSESTKGAILCFIFLILLSIISFLLTHFFVTGTALISFLSLMWGGTIGVITLCAFPQKACVAIFGGVVGNGITTSDEFFSSIQVFINSLNTFLNNSGFVVENCFTTIFSVTWLLVLAFAFKGQ